MRKMSSVKIVFVILSLGFLSLAGNAWAYTINDTILVGRGTTNGTETGFSTWIDHIDENSGSPSGSFNIFGINTSISGGSMRIGLFSNFDGNDTAGGVSITLADLGLDLNRDGRYEYGVALTARENGIITGRLYGDVSWNTSKYYLEGKTGTNYYYGEAWGDANHNPLHVGQNPIVHIASGTELGAVTLGNPNLGTPFQNDIDGYPSYRYDLSISLALFGVPLGNEIGIFWGGSTCANDIIEGTAPVPVPASILLLATGLVGMLAIAKRRRPAA